MASCCLNPANNPNALEYGKGYKKQNNAGCCGCGGCNQQSNDNEEEETTTVIRSSKTREDYQNG